MGRLKTLQRAETDQLPALRLTKRDGEIIKAVYEHRAMTTPQIEALLFPPNGEDRAYGKKTRCQLRLKLLYHHGYLWRDEQPTKLLTEGKKPLIYRIDKKAFEVLPALLDVEPEEIDWQPRDNQVSDPFLEHLLRTNDVRVAIEVAIKNSPFELVRWRDDRNLKNYHAKDQVTITGPQGGTLTATIIPDSYFHLRTSKNLHHFLEVDLGNTVAEASVWGRRDWSRKIRVYNAYHDSGLYKARYQAENFRVLIITTSPRRQATLKKITEETGGKRRFWFTSFDQLNPQTVLTEPIWQVATKPENEILVW